MLLNKKKKSQLTYISASLYEDTMEFLWDLWWSSDPTLGTNRSCSGLLEKLLRVKEVAAHVRKCSPGAPLLPVESLSAGRLRV